MTSTATPVRPPSGTVAVPNGRWLRLIPIAMVVYVISFMDRTNISYAFAGMGRDLGIDKSAQGLVGGIFFVGYVFLQIPGGMLAERWSAKKFIGIMILIWGAMAILEGFVQNFTQLLIVRFFLGVAEGGVWPATLVLLSHWFPSGERARAYGFWMMNLALASIITQPLSGFIVATANWRGLFIVEGILPFVIAAPLWWTFVADRPSEATWLAPAERRYIEDALAIDRRNEPPPLSMAQALRSSIVWQLVAVYFLIQVGFYGLNLWLPTLIKDLTQAGFGTVGLIAALPYVVAVGALALNGIWADRTRKYRWHVFGAVTIAAVFLALSVLAGTTMVWFSIAAVSLAMAGALAYDGPFWAAASRALPVAVAGGAMGLINALGNLGGFFGPSIGGYLQQTSGNFTSTAMVLAGALFLAGLVMLTVKTREPRATAAMQVTTDMG
jgi:sugar phosphate permease